MNTKIQQAIDEMTRAGYQREADEAYRRWLSGERYDLASKSRNRDALVKLAVKAANAEAGGGS